VSENPGKVDMMRKNRIRDKRGDGWGGGEEGGGDVPKKRNKFLFWGRIVARSGKLAGGAANAVCRL
jgi:hypothetical protein